MEMGNEDMCFYDGTFGGRVDGASEEIVSQLANSRSRVKNQERAILTLNFDTSRIPTIFQGLGPRTREAAVDAPESDTH